MKRKGKERLVAKTMLVLMVWGRRKVYKTHMHYLPAVH